jgi:hypothetical protein
MLTLCKVTREKLPIFFETGIVHSLYSNSVQSPCELGKSDHVLVGRDVLI